MTNTWLIERLTATDNLSAHKIWCADENTPVPLPSIPEPITFQFITNRWDLAQAALSLNYSTDFNDFDFSKHSEKSVDQIFYSISKEKFLVHHIINQAWRCLKMQGQLLITGEKNQGVKTYAEKIAQLLGCSNTLKKQGNSYTGVFEKQRDFIPKDCLDDNHYTQLRTLDTENLLNIYSKPGLFGWNKIDIGSELLIQTLTDTLASLPRQIQQVLDLGCGYGYLTLKAADLLEPSPPIHWTLTDNNAAALLAAHKNCAHRQLNADVVAADCAHHLRNKFDLILCNPPFHQGFSVESDLTHRFLAAAQRLLAPQGRALFVVNEFIPLERKAALLFKGVEKCKSAQGFKVVRLWN